MFNKKFDQADREIDKLTYISDFDCSSFSTFDGVKSILVNSVTVSVKCSLGGWTVIQSRGSFGNPRDYFKKSWTDYVNGFGTPGVNFIKNSLKFKLDIILLFHSEKF